MAVVAASQVVPEVEALQQVEALTPGLGFAEAVEESAVAAVAVVAVDESSETPEAVAVAASQSSAAPAGC